MAEKIIDEHLDIYLSITGWTVVHRVLVKDDELGKYWDNEQTGIGKYRTKEEALVEAKNWSKSDEIPLKAGLLWILHYELPHETGDLMRTFCGKLVTIKEVVDYEENITCEKCKEELKKYNESGQNV